MKRTGRELEQVYDIVAFRIITDSVQNCYAALGIVHSNWMPVPGRFKDYIALPKPNLYQSLHTTVIGPGADRMEVQIRTPDMHRTAEQGIAAHWQYKEPTVLGTGDRQAFAWLHQLMEWQRDLKDPTEFIQTVKIDLFQEEVFVFTPKGDVKALPKGATPIDFAYAVHSKIGDHCSGARVNGVMVPLRYPLRNGDTVDIITSNSQRPVQRLAQVRGDQQRSDQDPPPPAQRTARTQPPTGTRPSGARAAQSPPLAGDGRKGAAARQGRSGAASEQRRRSHRSRWATAKSHPSKPTPPSIPMPSPWTRLPKISQP